MTGKSKLWWTLEEDEGFDEDYEGVIGDPTPTFQVLTEDEDEDEDEETVVLLGPDGNELPRPAKTLGFLAFGEE